MSLDHKIEEALLAKTEWDGSADQLWHNISRELKPQTPWWQKQSLWFVPTIAAAVVIFFVFQSTLSPLPPTNPELENVPKLRMFSAPMDQLSPINVEAGSTFDLQLEVNSLQTEMVEPKAKFSLWKQVEGEADELIREQPILQDELINQGVLPVQVPLQNGRYKLLAQGQLELDGDLFSIYAEQEIVVQSDTFE